MYFWSFDIFSTFSGLKPNKSKCKTAGLGALKEVKLALCGMECIDLVFNTIKILEGYYSYDKNSENFSVAGKIAGFKTLAISKIVHFALVKLIRISTVLELYKIKKHFIWKNDNPKTKQDTLCKDYEDGDLKNVDITFKIISLQYS